MMLEQLEKFGWKRIIWFLIILLLLGLIVYVIAFFHSIEKSRITKFDQSEKHLLAMTDIRTVDQVFEFHEEVSYHIVYGKTDKKEEKVAFIPIQEKVKEKSIKTYDKKELMTKSQVEKLFLETCSMCEIIQSGPAMIDKKPLWEITYFDEDNRYVMVYYNLTNGKIFETLKLQRKYHREG